MPGAEENRSPKERVRKGRSHRELPDPSQRQERFDQAQKHADEIAAEAGRIVFRGFLGGLTFGAAKRLSERVCDTVIEHLEDGLG